jgi:hypothetical protein
MNMDVMGYFEFGDAGGVQQFTMAHYFAHDAEAKAIVQQFGQTLSTFNVDGQDIQDDWIGMMDGTIEQMTPALYDWLQYHNDNHQEMLAAISGSNVNFNNQPVDLSLVDFSDPVALYDWLTLHIQIHQIEQQALGLT